MRTQVMRTEVQRLLQQVPFRPFVLALENGETVLIDHPENIAFEPAANGSGNGSADFYVISGGLRLFSTFGAVTSATLVDVPGVV
ncbi:MAG: hypothetical protein IID44_12120 [Planctomycetes bacterium]|nr:hypothetical protein [Planctomycetota bacterium]